MASRLDKRARVPYCTSVMVHKSDGWQPALDENSPVPLYEQMIEEVACAVRSGVLGPGDSLPSVRDLAARLRVNPNTSAKALRDMERLGLSRSIRGVGSVVADGARKTARKVTERALAREIGGTVRMARRLGFSLEELHQVIERQWREEGDDGD